jgi:hypothetical protein
MQLNQIRLSTDLLQALYTGTLVLPENQGPASNGKPAESEVVPISYLGRNQRKFTVLVHYPNELYLPDDSLQFLGSVLKACQLTIADVAIVNLARTPVTMAEIRQQLSPAIIIAFGGKALAEGFPAGTLLASGNAGGLRFMQGPELEVLSQPGDAAKPLKKLLWESLKHMLEM